MPRQANLLAGVRSYWPVLYWIMHTVMFALFLALEGAGFRMPVGSSLFWFGWLALWMTHGLALLLLHARERERTADPEGTDSRFRRRMGLGVHTALYLSFGPAVILWWLVARQPGPQQPGEGQGLWIYPLWLLFLLAHSVFVVSRERRALPVLQAEKLKRSPVHRLSDDGELEEEDGQNWTFEPEFKRRDQHE